MLRFPLRSISLIIFFLFSSILVYAQTPDPCPQGAKHLELSNTAAMNGDWEGLIKEAKLAIPHFEKCKDWERLVEAHGGVIVGNYYLVNYEACEIYLQKGYSIAEEHLDKSSQAFGFLLNLKGLVEHENGNFAEEIKAYNESLMSVEAAGDKFNIANTYLNIGDAYKSLGDDDTALEYFLKSKGIYIETQGSDSPWVGRIWFEEGRIAYNKKQYLDSKANFEHALEILRSDTAISNDPFWKPIIILALRGLAEVNMQLGELENATKLAEESIEIQDSIQTFERFSPYNTLGQIQLRKGEYAKAIDNFNIAIQEAQTEFEVYQKHEEVANQYYALASAYEQMGDGAKALEQYQQALIKGCFDFNSTQISDNPEPDQFINKLSGMKILEAKARCLYGMSGPGNNNIDLAHQTCQAGEKLIAGLRESILSQSSKLQFASNARTMLELGLVVGDSCFKQTNDQKILAQSFQYLVSSKALSLLESILAKQATAISSLPEELRDQLTDYRNDLAYYQRRINTEKQKGANADLGRIEKWEQENFKLKREFESFEADLVNRFPEYKASKKQVQEIMVDAVKQHAAKQNALLLDYFIGEENSFVFAISGDLVQLRKFEALSKWQAGLFELLNLIQQPPYTDSFVADQKILSDRASRLFDLLLKPELSGASDGVERLIVIPDNILGYLPFEVLITSPAIQPDLPKTWAFLFKDYSIQYHFSSSLLLNPLPKGDAIQTRFLGMAPSFSDGPTTEKRTCDELNLYNLACSGEEVNRIQSIMGGEVITGIAADTKRLFQKTGGVQVLHLATHACVNPVDPLLSRIFFADKPLDQYSLLGLDLNAELVVLSACNTADGKLYPGEGISSLGRGFYQAGCPSLLTSLWSVDDCATAELMAGFYEELDKGVDKDAAIRAAKLKFLESAPKAQQHPYYWAAFVMIGEADGLTAKWTFKYWWLFGGLFILGLIGFWWYTRRQSSIN